MKKSEIIGYLESRKCGLISYFRDFNQLNAYVKYLSGDNLTELENKGLRIFLQATKDKILMEIIGDIEWD